jgi:ABC-type phosphate/phosphonate transport system substrate-binding protein
VVFKEWNMPRPIRITAAGAPLLVFLAMMSPSITLGGDASKPGVRIAMPDTLFPDMSNAARLIGGKAYQNLLGARAGVPVEVVHLPDAATMAEQLDQGKLQLGVFQGFEFAWAKEKCADLRPLVVAVPHCEIRVCLLVRADSKMASVADLDGKKVGIPAGTRDYARMYLEKLRAAEATAAEIDFELVKPDDADEALEDVIDGKLSAAVVTEASRSSFQDNKPGRYRRLKLLARSPTWPLAVIAYKKGLVDTNVLNSCAAGFTGAEGDIHFAVPLRVMQLKGFAAVPRDYSEQLAEILRAYPAPDNAPNGRSTSTPR